MAERDEVAARNAEREKDLQAAGESPGVGEVKSAGNIEVERTAMSVADALNRVLAADPAAICALVTNRMPVASAVVDLGLACDSLPVLVGGRVSVQFPAISALTLINVALEAAGLPLVAMMTGNKSAELRGFVAVRRLANGTVEPILPAVDQAAGQAAVAGAGETPT